MELLKLVTIIGARPQFIKAATFSREIASYTDIKEIIVHTGQHYDVNMSDIFFDELKIPKPDYNIGIGSFSHGKQTGRMLEKIEEILLMEKPDWVMVYGDTNSTLAGALAATKLHIKTAHVEAGLRSHNRAMPEEINRVLTDHTSDLLFAPTYNAMKILEQEGLKERAIFSGDVMYDSIIYYKKLAAAKYSLDDIVPEIQAQHYYLATIHRAENTDDPDRLQNIFTALSELDLSVLLPLHPRTKKCLKNIVFSENIKMIEPVGYLKMLILLDGCTKVFTDSGGLQKEAYFMQKPCITLRNETEWIETLEGGWNFVVGDNPDLIKEKTMNATYGRQQKLFGDGNAVEKMINNLKIL